MLQKIGDNKKKSDGLVQILKTYPPGDFSQFSQQKDVILGGIPVFLAPLEVLWTIFQKITVKN